MTVQTANDLLMGGGGAPAARFDTEGASVTGRIVAISAPYQEREYDRNAPGQGGLRFFPKSGDPIMTFNFDIATTLRDPSIEDDDGTRRVYMDGSRIKKAFREHLRAIGAPGLEVGGTITLTVTHFDTPGDIRSGKNWAVQYTPPSQGAAANAVLGATASPAAPVATPAPAAASSDLDTPLTDAQVTSVKAMSTAGLAPEAIAATLGLSPGQVASALA